MTRLAHAALKDFSRFIVTVDGVPFRAPQALSGQPLMMAYPDQGQRGLSGPFRYGTVSFSLPGTVRFATIRLRL